MVTDREKYLTSVLKILSLRPRSRQEIVNHLQKKHVSDNLINQIIKYLEDHKLIDDAAFAKWVIESRSRSSPRGSRLLKQELQSKGIDPSTINHELSTMNNNESDLALEALQKKQHIWSRLTTNDRQQKSIRFLQSRGFSWASIETAIKTAYNSGNVN